MKNAIIGFCVGILAAFIGWSIVGKRSLEQQNILAQPSILVIPDKTNLTPGERFNLIIIPEKDTSTRWFDGIGVNAPPAMHAKMHSARNRYTFCELIAPSPDSFIETQRVKIDFFVSFENKAGNDQMIYDSIFISKRNEESGVIWEFE